MRELMPYSSESVAADLFLQYRGVCVYHTYKNDDVQNGARQFWFTTWEYGGEGDEMTFDVRELPTWARTTGTEDQIKEAIRLAIEEGHIKPYEE